MLTEKLAVSFALKGKRCLLSKAKNTVNRCLPFKAKNTVNDVENGF